MADPREDHSALVLFQALREVMALLEQIFRQAASEKGTTAPQWRLLQSLLHCGPSAVYKAAAAVCLSPANAVIVVDTLEQRGLIRRIKSERRQRTIGIQLSARGTLIAMERAPEAAALSRLLAEDLGIRKLDRLCALLAKLESATAAAQRDADS
jgi:DNA-binding MarR family transcriptional regulator